MNSLPRLSSLHCHLPYSIPIRVNRNVSIIRCLHASASKAAVAHPVTTHGPPPKTPLPAASQYGEHVERKKRQSELVKQGKELRKQENPSSVLKKRFWKDVHVKEVSGGHQVLLDARPIRSPSKEVLTIPSSKPHLANAIALEWDLLVSAQQGLKQHLIPLTSIVSRAEDIAQQDKNGESTTRDEIVQTSMRYLDTDTLLCWAPEKSIHDFSAPEEGESKRETVRDVQVRIAQPVIGFLATRVWPGIEIKPVLDSDSILPASQPQATKDVIRGWISGLPAYELAALERGFLAAKSLLIAVRLVVEWSQHFRDLQEREERFGVEQAAEAASVEVRWQTGMWGEVEDSHDVEKEDMKRQLGTVVLIVSGEGKGT